MAMGKALEDTASAAEVLAAMAGIPAAPTLSKRASKKRVKPSA
jgi:hypothetical protein